MNVTLRKATIHDVQAIVQLVYELATHEKKEPLDIKLTKEKILQHGFDTHPYFHILVAEKDKQLVAYALYFFTYAASAGAPILYLEDLFVREEYRKNKIGTRLLSELVNIGKQHQCCRMEWHAFTWNYAAIKFYQTLGATLKTDLVQVRLE